jgi:hypothetical protein
MDAPKTIAHLLKRVPSKSMHKTPYGLWTWRKPSLNYLHVWGYLVEVKILNPNVGKFMSKIVSCHFIGYSERSKGYCLYYSDSYTKFIETRHIVFLEDDKIRGNMVPREISIDEKRCVPKFQ